MDIRQWPEHVAPAECCGTEDKCAPPLTEVDHSELIPGICSKSTIRMKDVEVMVVVVEPTV